MERHRIAATQTLPIPVEEAWAFFSDPGNLSLITPPDLDFRVETPLPDAAYAGLMIDYSIRPLFGLRVGWRTEITCVDPPDGFADDQRRGPFALWHHEHRFRAREGGTVVEDLVTYGMRWDPFTRSIERVLVRPRLRAIFGFRQRRLRERFGQIGEAPQLRIS